MGHFTSFILLLLMNHGILAKILVPEIPEKCKHLSYCEDVPNYPEEQISRLYNKLSTENKQLLNSVKYHQMNVNDKSSEMELCASINVTTIPLAIKNKKGRWVFVINIKEYTQKFEGQICVNTTGHFLPFACERQTIFEGYTTRCEQKSVKRILTALDETTNIFQTIIQDIPSCCSCVMNIKVHNEAKY